MSQHVDGAGGGSGDVDRSLLCRRWGHSFEEDHDGIAVYRPEGFDFPRARGRAGLEFRPDGAFVDRAVGAGDASRAREGSWRADGAGRVRVGLPGGGARLLHLVHLSGDRLDVRREPS